MIVFVCDAPDCENTPGQYDYRIGINEYVPVSDDDDDRSQPVLLPVGEDGGHFCSLDCLARWVLSRQLEDADNA